MVGEVAGVGGGAVDQRRAAAAQERQPHDVEPGSGGDAAVVHDPALAVEHRHVRNDRSGRKPVAHTTLSMPPRPSRADRAGAGTAVGAKRCGASRLDARPVGPRVERVEQPAQLEVGQRAHVRQRSGELHRRVPGAGEPADERHPVLAQRVQVEGARRADELHRRQVPHPEQVRDGVPALVEQARRVHPPQDVAAPVGARQPHVLTDGQGHRPTRAGQLIGDLDPARRPSDHEHAAVGELAGVAVVRGGQRR